jgi:hypothetical protein
MTTHSAPSAVGCMQQPACLLQHARLLQASGWHGRALQYQVHAHDSKCLQQSSSRSSCRGRRACQLPCRADAGADLQEAAAAPKPQTLSITVGGREVRCLHMCTLLLYTERVSIVA